MAFPVHGRSSYCGSPRHRRLGRDPLRTRTLQLHCHLFQTGNRVSRLDGITSKIIDAFSNVRYAFWEVSLRFGRSVFHHLRRDAKGKKRCETGFLNSENSVTGSASSSGLQSAPQRLEFDFGPDRIGQREPPAAPRLMSRSFRLRNLCGFVIPIER